MRLFSDSVKRYRQSINPPYKSKDFLTITGTILAILLLPFLIRKIGKTILVESLAQGPTFTFTAAGDYSSSSSSTTPVLAGINPINSGASFNLVLGDMSYANLIPETAWCDYVKSNVGATYPFELIPGNHEDDSPAGHFIDNFELCLPHRLTPITGRYSR